MRVDLRGLMESKMSTIHGNFEMFEIRTENQLVSTGTQIEQLRTKSVEQISVLQEPSEILSQPTDSIDSPLVIHPVNETSMKTKGVK